LNRPSSTFESHGTHTPHTTHPHPSLASQFFKSQSQRVHLSRTSLFQQTRKKKKDVVERTHSGSLDIFFTIVQAKN
jgi:hypothetical protein